MSQKAGKYTFIRCAGIKKTSHYITFNPSHAICTIYDLNSGIYFASFFFPN